MRITDQLRDAIAEALTAAQAQGVLPAAGASEIVIEQPRDQGHGDFATSLPLKLARTMKMAPPVIAAAIVWLGDQLGVGGQLSTGVIVVLGIRIFSNVAAIRRHLFHA